MKNAIETLKKELYFESEQITLEMFANQKMKESDIKIYHNALEWALVFPEILSEEGKFLGFDCIIGNPPYGAEMSEGEKKKYRDEYSDVHMRMQDTYLYFISLANRLVKNKGLISYIVPNNFFYQVECQAARELMIEQNCMLRTINLGDGVFSTASVPTCIFVSKKTKKKDYEFDYSDFRQDKIENVEWDVIDDVLRLSDIQDVPFKIIGVSKKEQRIVDKIKEDGINVGTIFEVVSQGITTGGNEAYIYTKEDVENETLEEEYLKPLLIGANVRPYRLCWEGNFIAYIDKKTDLSKCPNIEKKMLKYRDKLSTKREVQKGIQPWYSFHWPRKREYFEKEKILMCQTGSKLICSVDRDGFYSLNSTLVLNKSDLFKDWSLDLCVALFNSRLMQFQYNVLVREEKRGYAEVKPSKIRELYFPPLTSEGEKAILEIVNKIYKALELGQMIKVIPYRKEIDNIIYKECKFNDKEIAIIEN